jgi:ubiquinone/menaquinone biosynthesis C-methylase UbiE
MENKKAFDFWINKAENTTTAIDVKLNPINDHTQMDADFILKYADKTTSVLDLGTGTGLIVNKLYDRIGKITCVKPFESFTKYITRSDNIKV